MSMTLATACGRFLEHARYAKGLSVHSLRAYGTDLRQFRAYAGDERKIGEIDRAVLEGFLRHLLDERRLLASSVKRRFATLKVMFAELERDAHLTESPFRRFELRLKLPRRLPRNLTKGELAALAPDLECRRRRTQPAAGTGGDGLLTDLVILLLLTTGIRVGELTEIRLREIDLDDRSIRIRGKGNRERRVFLVGDMVTRLLRQYLDHRRRLANAAAAGGLSGFEERLLLDGSGAPAKPADIRRLLRARSKALGLDRRITPHMLRHTAATRYLEQGVDIRYVQRLLGHASISTTEIYAAASDEGLRRAIGG